MPEYVAKIRTLVRYARPHEEQAHGVLSLASVARHHDGPETILERLNAPSRVIPFESPEAHSVTLIRRLDLAWVVPPPGTDTKLIGPGNFQVTRQEQVRVRLEDGETLEGVLQMDMPEGFNRVSDFMNAPEDFFPLATPDGIYLVNKSRVREIRLFVASPKPRAA